MIDKELLKILSVPGTNKELQIKGEVLLEKEGTSGLKYPIIGGIPWLFPSPLWALDYWDSKKAELLNFFEQRINQLNDQLKNVDLHPLTQKRLQQLKLAYDKNQKSIEKVLSSLNSFKVNSTQSIRIPSHQTLTLYFDNLFRDWAWETDENHQCLNALKKIIPPEFCPNEFVVLGSGGSRLAVDLHLEYKLKMTIAVDFNPLLLSVAKRITDGQKVKLVEIPKAPNHLDNIAIERELQLSNSKAPIGFHYVYGDVQELPFQQESISAVLTPWLIDILPMDFKLTCQRINRILKMGGEWINFGPLGFMHSNDSICYSIEEIKEILLQEGFHLECLEETEIPYMQSPLSGQKRFEKIFLFRFKKTKSVAVSEFEYLPDYLRNYDLPIPLSHEIENHRPLAKVNADVFFSIDGKKSINELSMLMAKHYQIEEHQARLNIVSLLTKFEESRRRR